MRGALQRKDAAVVPLPASSRAALLREGAPADGADDRPKLLAAEIMREVYEELLNKIERRNFDVMTVAGES